MHGIFTMRAADGISGQTCEILGWGNGERHLGTTGLSRAVIHGLLVEVTAQILQASVDPQQSLVAQGLDSLGAVDLLEALHAHGYEADYEDLLSDASVDSLAGLVREKADAGPTPTPRDLAGKPVALTGPQVLWANLERQGWGDWANISLCLSMPASVISAAYLPAIAQSLCDANDAMRMVLVRSQDGDETIMQRCIPNVQLPCQSCDAPRSARDAMRLVEAFEGQPVSAFAPSARALVLASATEDGRHWLCITMHHAFCDRISMQSLARQIKEMIALGGVHSAKPPAIGYVDFANWQRKLAARAHSIQGFQSLGARLATRAGPPGRPTPRLMKPADFDVTDTPAVANLRPSESQALEGLAHRLGTTLPLLLHGVFSLLAARLTGDEGATDGTSDVLVCHVAANRERHVALKNLIGCFDTSVPVALRIGKAETLESFSKRTRRSFAQTYGAVSDFARGGWLAPDVSDPLSQHWPALLERVPHINIVRAPANDPRDDGACDIREHPVRRVQKTRWGLLLRVTLPRSDDAKAEGMKIRAFAEDRALASVTQQCFVDLLHDLLSYPPAEAAQLPILDQVDRVIDRARFAAAQVRRAAALVPKGSAAPFIYEKLVARQQRWYEHDARFDLCRDADNRFVGTAENPFPFTQLDKLKERAFLEGLGAPMPRLRQVLPKDGLQEALMNIASQLPESFVIKPVGAGHSFGVTVVRDGIDLTRNGVAFDVAAVAAELAQMAARGYCMHEGRRFAFNFSAFLIEDLVIDERGFEAPSDYKVFMIGKTLLWVQLHFRHDGHTWVAFVDADFNLLPQPAWDPTVCWRTHKALVCTDQAMVDARKPACLAAILDHAARLAGQMGIFVRLDWYADKDRGPLLGEITTFPHMLQPRNFYTAWANDRVRGLWQDPDGVGAPDIGSTADQGDIAGLMGKAGAGGIALADILARPSQGIWAARDGVTYADLHRYLDAFDLSPWGVSRGDRVGLLMGNGVPFAATLLAAMTRYVAVPIGSAQPAEFVAAQLAACRANALIVIAGTEAAQMARVIARQMPGLVVIALDLPPQAVLPELPPAAQTVRKAVRNLDDVVLVLCTSGATGDPKSVCFSLERLVRSAAMIGRSLDLGPDDLGVSMLPLHHVGGIACNLVAPMLAGGQTRFATGFDPKAFFAALAGPEGASWCYLVPAMWQTVLDYAKEHPELGATRPWPRLRAIRSAGADLPHALACALADLFGDRVRVLPTYGMTEAMPIAAPPLTYRLTHAGSVGRALPSLSIEIIDPTVGAGCAVVPDGTVGEVTVKGAAVFDGYDQGGPVPAEVLTPRGYFRTGDLGRLAADGSGWLSIHGRIKDAINRGGETIAPAQIEAVLRDYPGWQGGAKVDLMVFARAHADLGEDVALAVAPMATEIDLADLNDWARQHLPSSMLPQTLILVSEIARTETGKPHRVRFAQQMNGLLPPGKLGVMQNYVLDGQGGAAQLRAQSKSPMRDIPQQTVADVTLDAVLAVARGFVQGEGHIGPDTRFDDLGVNSLAAVELSARLSARFRCDLPTWLISDHPTPRAVFEHLIDKVQGATPEQTAGENLVAPPRQTRPLRMLFLHGEGADGDLMDLSLQATSWKGQLATRIEFVYLDAPHICAPKPELHAKAVAAGIYSKDAYRSWGVYDADMLAQSLSAVTTALETLGPIDAIGGICDGGLVAALIASRRPELRLFLNIAPSPLHRVARQGIKTDWAIACQSIHLVSHNDPLHSFAELSNIFAHCEKATLLQHDHGHAAPMLKGALCDDICAAIDWVTGAPPQSFGKSHRSGHDRTPVTGDRRASAKHEATVEKAMAEVLGHADFRRDDDFFDIGGSSYRAVAFAAKLEQLFGVEFPLESLFLDGTSVRDLAHKIETFVKQEDEVVLVPLNRSLADSVYYALPTFSGGLTDYLPLAATCAGSAKLVGLRIKALQSTAWAKTITIDDLTDMAADMIIAREGRKAINLIGFSAAGMIAFETARKLREKGHEINSLILIDAGAHASRKRWPVPMHVFANRLRAFSRRLRGKEYWLQRYHYVGLHLKKQFADWRPAPIPVKRPILLVAAHGPLQAREIDRWRAAFDGTLQVVPISGKHTGLRSPDIAAEIAQAIFGSNG